jgi:hypothetical protein
MSDGKQNFGQGAGIDPSTSKASIYPDVNSTACTTLNPCTAVQAQIDTVTVGTGNVVDPAIMMNLAMHSTPPGFYINTENDVCLLKPFFWRSCKIFSSSTAMKLFV